jgi:hypothetical protein
MISLILQTFIFKFIQSKLLEIKFKLSAKFWLGNGCHFPQNWKKEGRSALLLTLPEFLEMAMIQASISSAYIYLLVIALNTITSHVF